jgi:hypothetical protein
VLRVGAGAAAAIGMPTRGYNRRSMMGAERQAEADIGHSVAKPVSAIAEASLAPAAAGLLAIQRTAGNAAVGRLLRSGWGAPPRAGASRQLLLRTPLAPPTLASCGWIDGADVLWHIQDRSRRIREFLPTITISTDEDLKWYLRRWFTATSCIEQATATMSMFRNNTTTWQTAKEQYVEAVRIILVRAEEGLQRKRADLLTQNTDLIRPDAMAALTTYTQLDRFDRLAPGAGYASTYILKTMNPRALSFVPSDLDACVQTCPLAAATMQKYLRTGTIDTIRCVPGREPAGYFITPDPDTSWGPGRTWAATLTALNRSTDAHGKFVVIEADRGAHPPNNLTQWHYFVLLNIRGTLWVVDAYLGQVRSDVTAYVNSLQARTYKFTTAPLTVTASDNRRTTDPSQAVPN